MKRELTVHTIVRNEEKWIWYGLMSVKDWASQILVFDTGSTDKTVEVIKSIKDKKIIFEEKGRVDPAGMTKLRQEQLEKTKTAWFLILDGDEVWPKHSIKKLVEAIESASDQILAIVNRTYNLIGDVFHHLPEEAGRYSFFGRKGHYNIRAIRKVPGLHLEGFYPLEAYVTADNKKINDQKGKLLFLDQYLLHMTHLPRSSQGGLDKEVAGRAVKRKYELGISFPKDFLYPEVFYVKRPAIVPSPWFRRPKVEALFSALLTPAKIIKRKISP